MHVNETDALIAAQRAVGFAGRPCLGAAGVARAAQPADVASAVLLGRGAARQRGLVLVDAVDGAVVECLVESNPEAWADA